MEWNTPWEDPLMSYVKHFERLIGDQRTRTTFGETVKGIIAAGSLICRPDCGPISGVKHREKRLATRDPVGDRSEYEALGVGCGASDGANARGGSGTVSAGARRGVVADRRQLRPAQAVRRSHALPDASAGPG